jgi:hypothetical protein
MLPSGANFDLVAATECFLAKYEIAC